MSKKIDWVTKADNLPFNLEEVKQTLLTDMEKRINNRKNLLEKLKALNAPLPVIEEQKRLIQHAQQDIGYEVRNQILAALVDQLQKQVSPRACLKDLRPAVLSMNSSDAERISPLENGESIIMDIRTCLIQGAINELDSDPVIQRLTGKQYASVMSKLRSQLNILFQIPE